MPETAERPPIESFIQREELDSAKASKAFEALRGPKGPKGEKGEKGDKGEAGKSPQRGIDYYTPTELDDIIQMATPVKGKHYRDGKDGAIGPKGKDGKNGKDGKDGKDGRDGKDGSPDTAEQIVAKLIAAETKLPLALIEDIERKFEEVHSNMRRRANIQQTGGPTQYLLKVAGQEVGRFPAIDFVSGATITVSGQGDNATAKVSISGSGSPPKYADLSGQCDGSNKVFTIPANTTILSLMGSDAPNVYRKTTDFTGEGTTTLTLDATLNAPSQGATLILNYV